MRCNVSMAAGALTAAAGQPTAASNTLSVLWDQQGPQVSSGQNSMIVACCGRQDEQLGAVPGFRPTVPLPPSPFDTSRASTRWGATHLRLHLASL